MLIENVEDNKQGEADPDFFRTLFLMRLKPEFRFVKFRIHPNLHPQLS
jgi:hypothetical protein